jgi:hypothetical protein
MPIVELGGHMTVLYAELAGRGLKRGPRRSNKPSPREATQAKRVGNGCSEIRRHVSFYPMNKRRGESRTGGAPFDDRGDDARARIGRI